MSNIHPTLTATLSAQQLTSHLFTDSCASPTILLHGRQVPWLLCHHNRLLARTDRRHLRRLLDSSVPAHWWQGQTHRGLLLPKKVDVSFCFLRR